MEEKSNVNSTKKEMPENIRKMFEAKKHQNSNANAEVKEDENKTVSEDLSFKQENADTTLEDKPLLDNANENADVKKKKKKTKTKDEKLDSGNKKEKKKLSKKQKVIISVISSLVACALIVVVVFLFLPKAMKLETPVLQIYSLSNQTRLYVDENQNAKLYGFYIQKEGESVVTTISSDSNEVSIKSKLKEPGRYYVWAKYISNDYKLSSDESIKVTYDYYETLDTPIANLSQDSSQLKFNPVKNAKEYKIYYTMSNTEMNYFTIPNNSTNENIVFDLTQLRTKPAGIYNLYVQAIADSTKYYKNSELGEVVEYVNSYKLEDIKSASYDTNTKLLSFEIDSEKTNTLRFEININNGKTIQGYVASELKDTYVIDLTPYLNLGTTVTSLKIKALGDGAFVTSSEYFEVIIK